jgi:hypothetical protein
MAAPDLVWVNQQGDETPLEGKAGPFSSPRLSPDGNRVILAYRNDATEDLWMHDISRNVTERFVAEPASEWSADWTADGDRVVFTSRRDGPFQLYTKRANGLGDIERVPHSDGVAAILGRDGKLTGSKMDCLLSGSGGGPASDLGSPLPGRGYRPLEDFGGRRHVASMVT